MDFDSEDFEGRGKSGRGAGRKKKDEEARSLSKGELASMRAELREMLAKRVNVGVSEKYLTAGGVDVDELLRGEKGEFLGRADSGVELL